LFLLFSFPLPDPSFVVPLLAAGGAELSPIGFDEEAMTVPNPAETDVAEPDVQQQQQQLQDGDIAHAALANADLAGLLAAITTSGAGLTWIMRPITAYRIAATIGGTAAMDIPRSLFGVPMVLSLNSPQQIMLVDANCILFSDDNGFDIDTTEQASLQMSDSPTDPATASTVFESLWPKNLWAVKITRWIAYQRAQTGSVAYMTVAY
jgi:hypothetical protein